MDHSNKFNAHAKPPKAIKDIYKSFQKLDRKDMDKNDTLLDLKKGNESNSGRLKQHSLGQLPTGLWQTFLDFLYGKAFTRGDLEVGLDPDPTLFEVSSVPGKR